MFIAVRHGLCASVMIDKGQGAEFITVRLGFVTVFVRHWMTLVYDPQEKNSINTISSFYENITVQTERAILAGDSVFLVGDFNAKLGRGIIPNDRYDMSDNGQYLYKMITNYDLTVLNALDTCSGTFTRIKNKDPDEQSVIDYAITSNDLVPFLKSMAIYESRKITPWRKLKHGKCFTDHNTFLMKLEIPQYTQHKKVGPRETLMTH